MHDSVRAWVSAVVARYGLENLDVLDVGSRDINGTVRDLFAGRYVGVDIEPGVNVDQVIDPETFYQLTAERFSVIVSTEMLEHDPRPWRTLHGWARVLRPGGAVVLTARGFGPELGSVETIRCYGPHDYPHDYWRFSAESLQIMFDDAGFDMIESFPDPDPQAPGVFAVARKR